MENDNGSGPKGNRDFKRVNFTVEDYKAAVAGTRKLPPSPFPRREDMALDDPRRMPDHIYEANIAFHRQFFPGLFEREEEPAAEEGVELEYGGIAEAMRDEAAAKALNPETKPYRLSISFEGPGPLFYLTKEQADRIKKALAIDHHGDVIYGGELQEEE